MSALSRIEGAGSPLTFCLLPVARFAQDVIAPKVREMDEAEMMEPELIKALFEQGVSICAWNPN